MVSYRDGRGGLIYPRNTGEEVELRDALRRREGRLPLTESERVGVAQRRAFGYLRPTLRLVERVDS